MFPAFRIGIASANMYSPVDIWSFRLGKTVGHSTVPPDGRFTGREWDAVDPSLARRTGNDA
jgi:hypothetical protein